MFIYGFPTTKDEWDENPFTEGAMSPENCISEACHIYVNDTGDRYVGFDWNLGLDEITMIKYLAPFSSDLSTRKVTD